MRLYVIIYDNPSEIISKEAEPFLDKITNNEQLGYIKNYGYAFRFHLGNPANLVFDIDFDFKKTITLHKNQNRYTIDIIPIINKIKSKLREETINSILDEII